MTTTAVRSLALIGALGIVPAPAVAAQDASVETQPRAWVGILTQAAEHPWEQAFALLVTDIHVAGPAHRGGVLPGDLLVAVNGTALTSYADWLGAVSGLELGQPFRVGLLRGGRPTEVTIIADRRPGVLGAPFDLARLDAIQARVTKQVDSILRLMVDGGPNDSLVIGFMSAGDRLRAAEARIEITWRGPVEERRARRAEIERLREDEELRRMAEQDATPPLAGGGGNLRSAAEEPTAATPRALTSFVTGRPVVLGGIHVRDLAAELGRYFGLDSGVLVTDVLEMSPAARAGFQAGDVILAVAGRAVGSLGELRAALAVAVLPVGIAVVRRGERLELTYPPA